MRRRRVDLTSRPQGRARRVQDGRDRSVRLREGEISIEEGRIILGVMTLAGGEGGVSFSFYHHECEAVAWE